MVNADTLYGKSSFISADSAVDMKRMEENGSTDTHILRQLNATTRYSKMRREMRRERIRTIRCRWKPTKCMHHMR